MNSSLELFLDEFNHLVRSTELEADTSGQPLGRGLKKQIDALKNAEKHSTGIMWAFASVKLFFYGIMGLHFISLLLFTKEGKEGKALHQRQTAFFCLMMCFAGFVYNAITEFCEVLPLYKPTSDLFNWYETHPQYKNAIHQPGEFMYIVAFYLLVTRYYVASIQIPFALSNVQSNGEALIPAAETKNDTRLEESLRPTALLQSIAIWTLDILCLTWFASSIYFSFQHRNYFFHYYGGMCILLSLLMIISMAVLYVTIQNHASDFMRPRSLFMGMHCMMAMPFMGVYFMWLKQYNIVSAGPDPTNPDFATFIPEVISMIWISTYCTMFDLYLQFLFIYAIYQIHQQKTIGFCHILEKEVPRLVYLKNQGMAKKALLSGKPEDDQLFKAEQNLRSYEEVEKAIGARNLNLSVSIVQCFSYNCDFTHAEVSKALSLLSKGANTISMVQPEFTDGKVANMKALDTQSFGISQVTTASDLESSGYVSQTLGANRSSMF